MMTTSSFTRDPVTATTTILAQGAGTYTPTSLICFSMYGAVLRATRNADGRPVVLKVYDNACASARRPLRGAEETVVPENMHRELRYHRRLMQVGGAAHNIVELLDIADVGPGFTCAVFEHCSGGDLFEYINGIASAQSLEHGRQFGRTSVLPLHTVRSVIRQAAKALQFVHSQGLVHGDVSPENLAISDCDPATGAITVKLIDFGVASRISSIERGTRVLSRAKFLYTAPEAVWRGAVDIVDARAVDVYGLGMTLLAMTAGHTMYKDMRGLSTMAALGPSTMLRKVREVGNEPFDLCDDSSFMNLLDGVLAVDGRISLQQMLDHPWMREEQKQKEKEKEEEKEEQEEEQEEEEKEEQEVEEEEDDSWCTYDEGDEMPM